MDLSGVLSRKIQRADKDRWTRKVIEVIDRGDKLIACKTQNVVGLVGAMRELDVLKELSKEMGWMDVLGEVVRCEERLDEYLEKLTECVLSNTMFNL